MMMKIYQVIKKRNSSFRLYKFLNEVPIYSKDKHGINTSILIVQLLFFIKRREFDKVVDKLDSLKQYLYKYLRRPENIRANLFTRILLKLPKVNYNPIRLARHSEKHINELNKTKYVVTEQLSENEIIPYENLLKILFDLLSKTKPKYARTTPTMTLAK